MLARKRIYMQEERQLNTKTCEEWLVLETKGKGKLGYYGRVQSRECKAKWYTYHTLTMLAGKRICMQQLNTKTWEKLPVLGTKDKAKLWCYSRVQSWDCNQVKWYKNKLTTTEEPTGIVSLSLVKAKISSDSVLVSRKPQVLISSQQSAFVLPVWKACAKPV